LLTALDLALESTTKDNAVLAGLSLPLKPSNLTSLWTLELPSCLFPWNKSLIATLLVKIKDAMVDSQLELTNTLNLLEVSTMEINTRTLLKEDKLDLANPPATLLLPPSPATLPSKERLDCTNNCPLLAEDLSLFVLMLLPGLATLEES